MAQSPTVMAFRKRLKKRGYKEITITKIRGYYDSYAISASEPLAYVRIHIIMNTTEMSKAFK